ncbi:hypothetical protein [Microbacterium sp. A93]|uniref:hypothetical protein n=1 Tax=Microbacterium sp. A93 TaxID=3450716 RepID=UPI003F4236C3
MPIGIVGAVIAVLCALVAVVALARGSAGVGGGAVAVWIVGALLSLASGFSGEWIPALVAAGALVVALVLGGLLRGMVSAFAVRPKPVRAVSAEPTTVAVAQPRLVERFGADARVETSRA